MARQIVCRLRNQLCITRGWWSVRFPTMSERLIKAGNFSVWPRDRDPGAALDAALAAFAGVVEEEG
jgi:hypothetical protein